MNSIKRLSLLAALACVSATGLFADEVTSKYFFSSDLKPSEEAVAIAKLTQSVGFIKLTEKDTTVCRFDLLGGKSTLTKYAKAGATLTPIKSEECTGAVEGNTRLVRKGRKARSIQIQEKIASGLRATAKPKDITQVRYIDLYNSCIPLWINATSAREVRDFVDCVKDDLTDAAIDPASRPALLKPICLITLKNDLFLDTIDATLWQDLRGIYTMATFADSGLRKHVWNAKQSLANVISGEKTDINGNFWEGLFEDLSKSNYDLSLKKGVRKLISEVLSVKHLVGAAVVLVSGASIYAIANAIKRTWNERPAGLEKSVKAKKLLEMKTEEASDRLNYRDRNNAPLCGDALKAAKRAAAVTKRVNEIRLEADARQAFHVERKLEADARRQLKQQTAK